MLKTVVWPLFKFALFILAGAGCFFSFGPLLGFFVFAGLLIFSSYAGIIE